MARRRFQLTEEQVQELINAYANCKDGLTRTRYQAVRLYGTGYPVKLEIMYYPVAAPDLNPQEHVWKATRRAISHNHIIPRLPELADKFEQHLKSNTFESSFLDRYGFNSICPMFK